MVCESTDGPCWSARPSGGALAGAGDAAHLADLADVDLRPYRSVVLDVLLEGPSRLWVHKLGQALRGLHDLLVLVRARLDQRVLQRSAEGLRLLLVLLQRVRDLFASPAALEDQGLQPLVASLDGVPRRILHGRGGTRREGSHDQRDRVHGTSFRRPNLPRDWIRWLPS